MTEKEFKTLQKELTDQGAQLVAVSKTKPIAEIHKVHSWGQRDFGENRIQEINRKAPQCPSDIRWHLIGPLQSKKVKLLSENIHLFHAVDRFKILRMTEEHFQELGAQIDILIQVHIAKEDSKHGFLPDEVRGLFEQGIHKEFHHVQFRGLMGMATFTDDTATVRAEFDTLKSLYDEIKDQYSEDLKQFDTLSMGMSGDYPLALSCGSNMVRIGSKIFGARS